MTQKCITSSNSFDAHANYDAHESTKVLRDASQLWRISSTSQFEKKEIYQLTCFNLLSGRILTSIRKSSLKTSEPAQVRTLVF